MLNHPLSLTIRRVLNHLVQLHLHHLDLWPLAGALKRLEIRISGSPEIHFLGNPEYWNLKVWKFGIQQKYIYKKTLRFFEIQIHVANNVGKVRISQKNNFPAPFGAILGIFSMDRTNIK